MVEDFEKLIIVNYTGYGNIALWRKNKRACQCTSCHRSLEVEKGRKFSASRFSGTRTGYLCSICIARFFVQEENWQYNPWTFHLWPADNLTLYPISGNAIARAWQRGDQPRIHDVCVKTIKRRMYGRT